MTDEFTERQIVTGMIISTDYLRIITPIFKSEYLESSEARTLSQWCLRYYKRYNEAPGTNIQGIYTSHLQKELKNDKGRAEDIEQILAGLSDEFTRDPSKFNTPFLIDETKKHFRRRKVELLIETTQGELDDGELADAETAITQYTVAESAEEATWIDPFKKADTVREAFIGITTEPLIKFPGALGFKWNEELVRDGFVALMGPEKRGKTFWLMELAFRAARTGSNVCFFQAGDMSEAQQLRRMYVYVARKSNRQRYCGEILIPMMDCAHSQLGTCNEEIKVGVFPEDTILSRIKMNDYAKLVYEDEYEPCNAVRDCKWSRGAPWYTIREEVEPLTWKESYKLNKKFTKKMKRILVSTYPNSTLSPQMIRDQINIWERQHNFIPDVVVIDYADLLVPDKAQSDFRHTQNQIWMSLRGLSQERRCLVITATQADAASYDQETLALKNFSEDKRKYAHVTAMYGLNQTDIEKEKGIMRINDLVVREHEFSSRRFVTVLHHLAIGRPFLACY